MNEFNKSDSNPKRLSILAIGAFVLSLLAMVAIFTELLLDLRLKTYELIQFLNAVSLCGSITGVICGHTARAKIRKDPLLKGQRFALAGLIIGYFFLVAIGVVILGAILIGAS